MEGELLVVNGPRLGECFSLGAEVRIGRDPNATIRLDEPGVAWEHCVVKRAGERYRLLDRRSGTGSYVNGMRTAEHPLEPGDQVVVGSTVFVYREDQGESRTPSPQHSLLRACSLLFLFRALASAESPSLRQPAACKRSKYSGRPFIYAAHMSISTNVVGSGSPGRKGKRPFSPEEEDMYVSRNRSTTQDVRRPPVSPCSRTFNLGAGTPAEGSSGPPAASN
ncbi:MAG: hypothetical protein C5B51_07860 [Terriglobia bacterium]|nr:MAG: hypothetical protein C5B51_07860 [Terriglobia bacterium]